MELGKEDLSTGTSTNSLVGRIALVVFVAALVLLLVLAWWSGRGIPNQLAKLAGHEHLRLVRQSRDALYRHIDELRYKTRVLATHPDIIDPKPITMGAGHSALDRDLQELDLAEVQIRRFEATSEQLVYLGLRFPPPKPSERAEMLAWGADEDNEHEVRIEVLELPVGDRSNNAVLRYCTPVYRHEETKEFAGILCVWVSFDYLLSRYLDGIGRPPSYTFVVQSPIGRGEDAAPSLIRYSAEPDWIRGGGRDATAFLNALRDQTLIFETDDHDIVWMPQRDGRQRKDVVAYASTMLLPWRLTLGVGVPYEVVVEPYAPLRTSIALLALLTVSVLVVLSGLLYFQRRRLQMEAREHQQRQLLEMQHDYRELFAENPIAMLVVGNDQRLVDCNYSAERLLGLSRQEAVGLCLGDVFSHESVDSLWQSLTSQGHMHAREADLIRQKDQGGVVVEAWGRRIGDNWVIMANDVEQRRDLERQISRLRRMDSMGSLASTLAHDFNNLLGQVQILVSNLRADLDPGSGAVEEDLGAIEEKVDDASQLVANLLAFREDVVSKDPIWLEPVISEFVNNERKVIPDGISLELAVSDESPPVWITPYALRRVLDNLCRNACDAMRYGGQLRIRLGATRIARQGDFEQLPPGTYAVIEVSDTGSGMSQEMLDTVFEPFFSTKGQGRGTGLGLWTVYKIVRRAGGAVHVRSRIGKGTRFTIYLPTVKPVEDQS